MKAPPQDKGSSKDPTAQSKIARRKDPVCGMDVNPNKGYSKEYKGREYVFCSLGCVEKFDAEPERYSGD